MRLERGVEAPPFELVDLDGVPAGKAEFAGQKLWLILARFVACPFCSLRLQQVAERHSVLDGLGVRVLVVFPSAEKRVRRYVKKYDPPFRVVADPQQKIFLAFGSETSWAGELRTAMKIPKVMKALVQTKMNPLAIDAAPHQMPSEYLIDPDGTIAHAFYGEELDDGFPLAEVIDWAEG